MGININGSTDLISATDGGLDITGLTRLVGVSTAGITTAYIGSINNGPISGARNRIINGDMRIDQRNGGSALSLNGDAYTLDRWYCAELTDGAVTVQRVADGPSGFTNSAKITVSTADSSLAAGQITHFTQYLEGLNVDDLAFGTSSAKTITISFWVKSSVTGTFSGSLGNGALNRSYPFTYTINSANTWEYETITIPGDTTGTWATDNSKSFALNFSLGSGSTYAGTAGAWSGSDFRAATSSTNLMATLNATWNITGVQLEVGPTATEFERRSYGQELALCQRYCYKFGGDGSAYTQWSRFPMAAWLSSTQIGFTLPHPVSMRTTNRTLTTSGTAVNIYAGTGASAASPTYAYNGDGNTPDTSYIDISGFSGGTAGLLALARFSNNNTAYILLSAEL